MIIMFDKFKSISYIYIYIYICVCVCVRARVCLCMDGCMYVYMSIVIDDTFYELRIAV